MAHSNLLGFGLMRLPEVGEGAAKRIDVAQVCQMVDEFLAAGFTYFDTAWGYHNGMSEQVAKVALVDRYPRESFQLATKLPAWRTNTAERARDMFTASLRRTGAGYFDNYLLHNLGQERTAPFEEWGIWDFARDLRERGLVRRLGFSMHSTPEELDAVLTAHPDVDFVQLQVNYFDWENPRVQSRGCLEVARAHGVPVIVMEPVKGGRLASLTDAAAAPLRALDPAATPSSWALRFAAAQSGVERVLSGMSAIEQVRENVATFASLAPISDAERAALAEVAAQITRENAIPCTSCAYCTESCPEGVDIPRILAALNVLEVERDEFAARGEYAQVAEGARASRCIGCRTCEEACPQQIGIVAHLEKATKVFESAPAA